MIYFDAELDKIPLLLFTCSLFPPIIERIYYLFFSAHFPRSLGKLAHFGNESALNGVIRNLRYLFIPLNIRFTDIYLLSFHLRP